MSDERQKLKFTDTPQTPADTGSDTPEKPKRRQKFEAASAEINTEHSESTSLESVGDSDTRSAVNTSAFETAATETANPQSNSKLKQDQTRLNFEHSESDDNGGDGTVITQNHNNADDTAIKTDAKLLFGKNYTPDRKLDRYEKKLNKARDKLPSKPVKKKELIFDEDKGKAASKLTHENEVIPIGAAEWNKPTKKSAGRGIIGKGASIATTKIHAKIHQVEHENVGVKAAHQAELWGESAYRGGKRKIKSAYRHHKNKPYRKVAKLEQKSIKNKMRTDYKKALRDNPKLKSNPASRFMQKRAIKLNYAKDLRNAKKAAAATKASVRFAARAGKTATAIIRRNPVFLVKAGLLLLIIFFIMSIFTMCMSMFQGGTGFVGAVSYAAEYEDICDASVLYTQLETDLRIYIQDIQINHPGFDEYRLNIGGIGHNPFELIAFLTAVYENFTFAEVEASIRAIFDAQYTLDLTEVVEIRTREETGSWTDEDGNTHTYTVIVEYEWHILYVTLTSRPLSQVLAERMDEEQAEHYAVLMYSFGARQFIGNPFDFDWTPNVSSPFGYRVHPISGDRRFHWGIDIGLPAGTPIRAGLDGIVVYVGYHPNGYGNVVVIESIDGIQARYAHCNEIFVTVGQTVERGQTIATVGSTGASTGPHLHMEIAVNGRRINPIFFIEFRD